MKRSEKAARSSSERHDDGTAFLPDPSDGVPVKARDPLGEMLAEEFIEYATTGEAMIEDDRGEFDIEEVGGPFMPTTAKKEFDYATDASNPPGAEAESFPRTTHGEPTR